MTSPSLLLLRPTSLSLPSLPQLSTSRSIHGLLFSSRLSLFPNCKRTHLLKYQKITNNKLDFTCFYNSKEKLDSASTEKDSGLNWPILERWDVPWQWQTISLTMLACGARLPTPVSVLISAAIFALAHLTPGEFPQLFETCVRLQAVAIRDYLDVMGPSHHQHFHPGKCSSLKGSSFIFLFDVYTETGTALGLPYAHTRNLMTPIAIHALWNSVVILLLTFLQLQGYDIKELLLQAT